MRSEIFALFSGIACLSLGFFGLQSSLPDGVVHLAIGAWGITAWRHWTHPRIFAATLAVLFAAFALMGFVPALSALAGMKPLQGVDIWLYAGTAVVAAYFALRPELSAEHRAGKRDRREHDVPVAQERRHGHGDRRLPSVTEEI